MKTVIVKFCRMNVLFCVQRKHIEAVGLHSSYESFIQQIFTEHYCFPTTITLKRPQAPIPQLPCWPLLLQRIVFSGWRSEGPGRLRADGEGIHKAGPLMGRDHSLMPFKLQCPPRDQNEAMSSPTSFCSPVSPPSFPFSLSAPLINQGPRIPVVGLAFSEPDPGQTPAVCQALPWREMLKRWAKTLSRAAQHFWGV